ncbi:hypothetical protein COV19_07645 [Candidatus Woesearchaeota archaeon CG10_big_fil_rev_8_21_14_0_10_44_13]|nr:MAG: hypothetical protein COV19_07645 [Candidatus Woesearchaeota archaeon CG10_big_fil_rev_8_21_14_0_10_44_13]
MDVLYLIEQETKRRGYSPRTAETYCGCVRKFMRWVRKEPRKVTRRDIQGYIDRLVSRNAAGSTVNVYVNALRFLMEEILGKRILLRIRYSKVPKRLPAVLSKDEVKRLIAAVENPRHRLMIELMYSAGLRLNELTHLRAKDILIDDKVGWVRRGKGGKDRMFIIADKIKERLKEHISAGRLCGDSWVFPGRKGRPLSIRVPQEIVKSAAKRAGLGREVHCHTLRHSFATHLIEDGNNIMSVQHLLGHSDIDTTMVYIHVARPRMIDAKSPYDSFS